jgi:hypothetical protein
MSDKALTTTSESARLRTLSSSSGVLQRACACGQHTIGGGKCGDCKQKSSSLSRQDLAKDEPGAIPPIVYAVLESPGRPLDRSMREFIEPRLGHDFSSVPVHGQNSSVISMPGDPDEREADSVADRVLRPDAAAFGLRHDLSCVRVHADAKAAESARSVNALAYTVGEEVVFGDGQYPPADDRTMRLLAHELVHTRQQTGRLSRQPDDSLFGAAATKKALQAGQLRPYVPTAPRGPGSAARRSGKQPCYAGPECAIAIPGSATDFGRAVGEAKEQAKQDPNTAAPRRATNVEQALNKSAPGLLGPIKAVMVDPTMDKTHAGAESRDCGLTTEKHSDADRCISVPTKLENEAATFNEPSQQQTIGNRNRAEWQFNLVRIMTHEVSHVTFEKRTPSGITTRDEDSITELSELNSELSEFPVHYEHIASATTSQSEIKQKMQAVIRRYIQRDGESIGGILRRLRCINPCADVDKSVTAVFNTQTANWPREVRRIVLNELADPANHLAWPIPPEPDVAPPAPERPKFGPLYQPRGTFVPEMERSTTGL